ncbi:MAG: TatD family hydrolase, partial [Victivallales bacterium]
MKYFNIHRHSPANDLDETAITSLFPEQEIPENALCSIGIHPWHVDGISLNDALALLNRKCICPAVVAVGECGLDRACGVPFDLQLLAFRPQVELAAMLGKPLIIHCVRAYPELVFEKKSCRNSPPWIVHGFRGNPETASQLIKHGFHLSFGEALMNDVRLGEILASVPEDRYFLETDESNMSIREIYGKAASLRNTDPESIIVQQRKNALSLFGNGK